MSHVSTAEFAHGPSGRREVFAHILEVAAQLVCRLEVAGDTVSLGPAVAVGSDLTGFIGALFH